MSDVDEEVNSNEWTDKSFLELLGPTRGVQLLVKLYVNKHHLVSLDARKGYSKPADLTAATFCACRAPRYI